MTDRSLSPVDIKLEGIGHVLRDRRLEVPAYQRGYAWELNEVEEFWWDLRAAFQSSTPQYFLGTIVLTREAHSTRSMIVDGQQRLTTTSLLFIALRNQFMQRGDASRAQVIERDYGLAVDLRSGKPTTRLRLNPEDQQAYEAVMQAGTKQRGRSDRSGEPASRIAQALAFLEVQVEREAKNAGLQWTETLFRWVEFLEHRVRVITVSVGDQSDAFLIFETLNARGRALTVADLLKNYLFGLAGPRLEEVQADWMSALRALEASADEEVFTTYVRHLWSSFEGATRERELYSRLKAAISSRDAAVEFGQKLEVNAAHYAALLSADHPYWSEGEDWRPMAETLLRLGLEQNRPLLLAAMRTFEPREFARLLRATICWSTRGLIVGGIGGGTTERAYAEAAIAVSEARAQTVADVFKELASVIPTDDTFRQAFAVRRINRTAIVRYLLVAVAQEAGRVPEPYIVPSADEARFRLEAVLPRNADTEEWAKFADDDVAQWALRLGNLFVVDERTGASGPLPQLLKRRVWSPTRITERQEKLADIAVRVWPRALGVRGK